MHGAQESLRRRLTERITAHERQSRAHGQEMALLRRAAFTAQQRLLTLVEENRVHKALAKASAGMCSIPLSRRLQSVAVTLPSASPQSHAPGALQAKGEEAVSAQKRVRQLQQELDALRSSSLGSSHVSSRAGTPGPLPHPSRHPRTPPGDGPLPHQLQRAASTPQRSQQQHHQHQNQPPPWQYSTRASRMGSGHMASPQTLAAAVAASLASPARRGAPSSPSRPARTGSAQHANADVGADEGGFMAPSPARNLASHPLFDERHAAAWPRGAERQDDAVDPEDLALDTEAVRQLIDHHMRALSAKSAAEQRIQRLTQRQGQLERARNDLEGVRAQLLGALAAARTLPQGRGTAAAAAGPAASQAPGDGTPTGARGARPHNSRYASAADDEEEDDRVHCNGGGGGGGGAEEEPAAAQLRRLQQQLADVDEQLDAVGADVAYVDGVLRDMSKVVQRAEGCGLELRRRLARMGPERTRAALHMAIDALAAARQQHQQAAPAAHAPAPTLLESKASLPAPLQPQPTVAEQVSPTPQATSPQPQRRAPSPPPPPATASGELKWQKSEEAICAHPHSQALRSLSPRGGRLASPRARSPSLSPARRQCVAAPAPLPASLPALLTIPNVGDSQQSCFTATSHGSDAARLTTSQGSLQQRPQQQQQGALRHSLFLVNGSLTYTTVTAMLATGTPKAQPHAHSLLLAASGAELPLGAGERRGSAASSGGGGGGVDVRFMAPCAAAAGDAWQAPTGPHEGSGAASGLVSAAAAAGRPLLQPVGSAGSWGTTTTTRSVQDSGGAPAGASNGAAPASSGGSAAGAAAQGAHELVGGGPAPTGLAGRPDSAGGAPPARRKVPLPSKAPPAQGAAVAAAHLDRDEGCDDAPRSSTWDAPGARAPASSTPALAPQDHTVAASGDGRQRPALRSTGGGSTASSGSAASCSARVDCLSSLDPAGARPAAPGTPFASTTLGLTVLQKALAHHASGSPQQHPSSPLQPPAVSPRAVSLAAAGRAARNSTGNTSLRSPGSSLGGGKASPPPRSLSPLPSGTAAGGTAAEEAGRGGVASPARRPLASPSVRRGPSMLGAAPDTVPSPAAAGAPPLPPPPPAAGRLSLACMQLLSGGSSGGAGAGGAPALAEHEVQAAKHMALLQAHKQLLEASHQQRARRGQQAPLPPVLTSQQLLLQELLASSTDLE